MSSKIYLVRHGEDIRSELTARGREQAAEAAEKLRELIKRTDDTVLLMSDRLRAGQTAEIIGKQLNLNVIVSRLLGDAGNNPALVRNDLPAFLDHCLAEAGVEYSGTSSLVVVTHGPMLAAATGVATTEVRNGQVEEYDGHTWSVPTHW